MKKFRDPNEPTCSYFELCRRQSVDAAAKAEREAAANYAANEPKVDFDPQIVELQQLKGERLDHADFWHNRNGYRPTKPQRAETGARWLQDFWANYHGAPAAQHGQQLQQVPPDRNGPNPKDLVGRCKPDLALVTGPMMAALASGLTDGVEKYGTCNWRDIPVEARTYISAAMRHLTAWMDREEYTSDSDSPHLGNALATIAIVVDAQAAGTLIDNRPKGGQGASTRIFEQMTARRKARASKLALHPAEREVAFAPMPHPAQQLAVEAFKREQGCTSPASCHNVQRCLGGPSCPRHERGES